MRNLIAKPIPNGYSSTLTTYALKYLLEAEGIYGQRTNDFIYGGVELNELGPPKIWYPYGKFVVIQVSYPSVFFLPQAIFQISHEVIHVLSPNGKETTNNLEEGLATYFSKIITDRDSGDPNYAINSINPTKYLVPYTLVSDLFIAQPNAIAELRKVQPVIDRITQEDFKKANINIAEELICELLKPMDY
jgi:hypothetical protein